MFVKGFSIEEFTERCCGRNYGTVVDLVDRSGCTSRPAVTNVVSSMTASSLSASVLPARKCVGSVCIPGGEVKASRYTKTPIQVANGIDGRGRPYGYAVALRPGQSSKGYMEDADMAYLSSRQIAAGYKLYALIRTYNGALISMRVDSKGYKVREGSSTTFTAQR